MIARIGQALYGDDWRHKLARALFVPYRTIKRIELGAVGMSAGMMRDCLYLLEHRGSACAGLAAEVAKKIAGEPG